MNGIVIRTTTVQTIQTKITAPRHFHAALKGRFRARQELVFSGRGSVMEISIVSMVPTKRIAVSDMLSVLCCSVLCCSVLCCALLCFAVQCSAVQ